MKKKDDNVQIVGPEEIKQLRNAAKGLPDGQMAILLPEEVIGKQKRATARKDGDDPSKVQRTAKKELLPPVKRYYRFVVIFLIAAFCALITAIILSTTTFLIPYAISVWVTGGLFGLAFILHLQKLRIEHKQVGKEKKRWYETITDDQKRSAFLTLYCVIILVVLLILAYLIHWDSYIIAWVIAGVIDIRIIGSIWDRLEDVKKNPKKYYANPASKVREEYDFSPKFYLAQHVIFMILVIFGFHTLFGNNLFQGITLPSINAVHLQLNLAVILVALSSAIGIMQERIDRKTLRLKQKEAQTRAKGEITRIQSEQQLALSRKQKKQIRRAIKSETYLGVDDLDYDKTGLPRYFIALVLPVITLLMFPIAGQIIEGSPVPGQSAGYDFFNGIYLAIIYSQYTQFTMVILIISSLSIIIGKARGRSGTASMVIGSLGMAGVPMIVTILAFVGQVPAPDIFYDLFGQGFGNLIFAISYTSVISLALALMGVFYEIVPASVSGNLD